MRYRLLSALVMSVVFLFTCMGSVSYGQQITVQGTVTSESGETLPGVNILVKGTSTGTSTNTDGYYELSVPSATDTLVFSFVGYQTREIPINNRNRIDVVMTPSTLQSEEVVVVGYGTQRKSDLTGSVSSVEPEDINNIPTSNVQDALQGKVAGVQITPQSGAPGAQSDIKIRGVGTLNNSSPLYVVDGMLVDDISFLSPNNIKSLEVLKDASATAIYGSRGANGVIIVTTKDGQEGETNISFSSYQGIKSVSNKIDLVNAQQYATLANELASNEGLPQVFSNPNQVGPGTNWQNVIFQPAHVQSYNLSASGGSENMTYSISGNYFNEGGTIEGSDYERATLRVNNSYHLTDNIDFGHNVALSYSDRTDEPGGIVSQAYGADPTIPIRNQDGDFSNAGIRASTGNPAATLKYNRNDNYQYRTFGNAYVEVNFLDNFNFKSSLGIDISRTESKDFTPQFFVSPTQQVENNRLSVREEKQSNWLLENTLEYAKDWKDHSITLLGGVTLQEYKYEDIGGSRINFPGSSTEYWYLNAGEQTGQTNFNSAFSWGMLSYLGRANYTYQDRYLLTVTYRVDGSSRFGEEYRYGYFPSVAAGWRISNEAFMENVDLISNLKLRASWGVVGNDKISAYPGVATITPNVNAVFGTNEEIAYGATQTELSNPTIRWEETEQVDIGVELGLLEDRFTAEVDYYRRKTKDILVRVPIPDYVGVNTEPFANAASVVNRGLDINVNWRQSSGDFSYNVGVVASTVNNEVLSLGQGREEIFAGGLVNEISSTTRTYVGGPIGAFYGYEVVGVFQNQTQINNNPTRGVEVPGDLQYKDQLTVDTNGDGVPDEADGVITAEDRVQIGSPIADFSFGLNFGINYKNFDFSANIDGQTGNQIFNAKKNVRFGIENFEESYLDRWTGEGTSNTEPRITNSGHNYLPSERFLEDGDYIRLRNVQLGYTLPQQLLGKANVRNVRVYVSGTNVYTLTGYSGYTPQIGGGSVIATGIDTGIYPTSTTYSVGVEVSF